MSVARRTVQKHLRDAGHEKHGRDYWVTEEMIAMLRDRIQDSVGNPQWRKPK